MNDVIKVRIPWKPRAKGRPRFSPTGVPYTPKETREAEEAFGRAFKEALPNHVPIDETVEVTYEFTNTHVDVTIAPHQRYEHRQLRGDIDNYLKLVNDALNKIAWTDDRLIVKLTGVKK